jgi:aromatic-L-amino-acid decarboxylase
MHVDAAYGGAAAICPELRPAFEGLEEADSIVVNPHKWLFTPIDCSVLLVRDPAQLRDAYSVVPAYLETGEAGVTNLMDYGIQLGRRFRALKLWMVIRAFGVEGLRARIRQHCALAREFADWVEADPRFDLVAPVPFSVVCFRARSEYGEDEDDLNRALLRGVNAAGPVFLSSTELSGRFTLRLAVGNIRTEPRHVEQAWHLVQRVCAHLRAERRRQP